MGVAQAAGAVEDQPGADCTAEFPRPLSVVPRHSRCCGPVLCAHVRHQQVAAGGFKEPLSLRRGAQVRPDTALRRFLQFHQRSLNDDPIPEPCRVGGRAFHVHVEGQPAAIEHHHGQFVSVVLKNFPVAVGLAVIELRQGRAGAVRAAFAGQRPDVSHDAPEAQLKVASHPVVAQVAALGVCPCERDTHGDGPEGHAAARSGCCPQNGLRRPRILRTEACQRHAPLPQRGQQRPDLLRVGEDGHDAPLNSDGKLTAPAHSGRMNLRRVPGAVRVLPPPCGTSLLYGDSPLLSMTEEQRA